MYLRRNETRKEEKRINGKLYRVLTYKIVKDKIKIKLNKHRPSYKREGRIHLWPLLQVSD